MNVERINLLADTIDQHSIPGLGFNMIAFAHNDPDLDMSGHHCGTTACIAGYAAVLAADLSPGALLQLERQRVCPIHDQAQSWLGITPHQAEELFYNHPDHVPFSEVEPHHAVRVLRNLAATGEVDWNA